MRKLTFEILLLLLLANLILSSLPSIVLAVSHPRNYTEATTSQFKGIIEPDNPVVLQKLHELCPTIDEQHFTSNLLAVYTYAMLIPYAYDTTVYGVRDYWQTAEETITLGRGDCEDQAINLATLVEALYKQTYGYIPLNLVWVVIGHVQTSGGGGGHGWVIINEGILPQQTAIGIRSVSVSEAIIDIVLGGIAELSDEFTIFETSLDLSTLPSKSGTTLSVFYAGEKYFELEPTWNLPISEFCNKKYPYTQIYAIFNSQTFHNDPTFYPVTQPPIMGAEIRNVAFPAHVTIGDHYTINVTVQNYELGILGADLVVILKRNGNEVVRQNSYVWKYLWQVHTFVFQFIAVDPAGDRLLSVELYHDNWGTMELKNYENFTVTALSISASLPPQTTASYDGFWHNTDFTIPLSATDENGVYMTYYRINNGTTKSVSNNGQPLITTEGVINTLEYWSVDSFGNVESPHHVITGIKLDKSPPTGSILINQGEAYTNLTEVSLTLSAEDSVSGISQMQFSNDNSTWSSWESYSTSKSWSLQSGDGIRNVFVQYRDLAGLIITAHDSINLDLTPPNAVAGQNQTVTVGTSVSFNGGDSTDNTGVASYLWDFGDGTNGTGVTSSHIYMDTGVYIANLTVFDLAGNSATCSSTVYVVEEIIPESPAKLFMVFIFISFAVNLVIRKKVTKESKLSLRKNL